MLTWQKGQQLEQEEEQNQDWTLMGGEEIW